MPRLCEMNLVYFANFMESDPKTNLYVYRILA